MSCGKVGNFSLGGFRNKEELFSAIRVEQGADVGYEVMRETNKREKEREETLQKKRESKTTVINELSNRMVAKYCTTLKYI